VQILRVFDKYQKRVQPAGNSGDQYGPEENWKELVAIEDHKYPTLTRRYITTAIDVAFVFVTVIMLSYLLENSGLIGVRVRVGLILFLFFIYEPLSTSRFCTLGQKIMGVRVRKYPSLERISILMAYTRIIIKGLLGILSFFTLPFSQNRRAIHDMAARSIVIFANKKEPTWIS